MRNAFILSLVFLFGHHFVQAQINYTANDQVTPYDGHFRLGSNMGAYSNWTDDDLANIAVGNPNLNLKGAGVRSLRPALPENFLEFFGYDIRESTFQHYASIDAQDNVAFIGYPSDDHRDPQSYCPNIQSSLFANLYTDIWDGGANGTPVNDENYYALYLYKMVNIYKDEVKFWEIWNEPDFDFSANGWKPKGEPGNWYENIPDPCDYQLRAPIFHYIRMLRISYEVIKFVDPTAYIAVGGLGFPSFLDLILRHTDNPDQGLVTTDYPLHGGAYFDVLSYHSYPHFDGSLRYWSNDINGFVHLRHSDAATNGVINKKYEFQEVLNQYGYNGVDYPTKEWIITESNIPRLTFGEYIGSPEAQRNFLIKTYVACQQNEIAQFHLYTMADAQTEADATNEFDVMGWYKKIEGTTPYQQQPNPVAIAGRTTTQLIYQKTYDPTETQKMQLPDNIGGGAFKASDGQYTYVLWAKTDTDRSEVATANYSFPANMNVNWLNQKEWDYSVSGNNTPTSATGLVLTGSPIFLTKTTAPNALESLITGHPKIKLFPNPGNDILTCQINLSNSTQVVVDIVDSKGQLVLATKEQYLPNGFHEIALTTNLLSPGVYWVRLKGAQLSRTIKWIKL